MTSTQELRQRIDNLRADQKDTSERLTDLDDLISNKLLPTCMAIAAIYTESDEEKRAQLKANNPEIFEKFIAMIDKGREILSKKSYCADCNLMVDKEDKFCKKCGKKL